MVKYPSGRVSSAAECREKAVNLGDDMFAFSANGFCWTDRLGWSNFDAFPKVSDPDLCLYGFVGSLVNRVYLKKTN